VVMTGAVMAITLFYSLTIVTVHVLRGADK
jgi:hypothetical protein